MNLVQQFQALGHKQLAMEEGPDMLRQLQQELARTRVTADAWGVVALLSNLSLIPLNCIINAFELKAANSIYQLLVRTLYSKFAQSGARIDGAAKQVLSLLKKAIADELKRKALTEFVPGVNILVGLAEDSFAAMQTVQTVERGGREIRSTAADLGRKIAMASAQLTRLGVQRAEVLGRLQTIARTA